MAKERFYRVNERIRFSPVVVVDQEGKNLGEMPTLKARALAEEQGLDLVEINPSARPPICKIMDFGKYKYDLSKREKQSRAHQKEVSIKEVRLTAKIGDHDIDYKAKQARDFFLKGNKVKVSMRLRGRENAFVENALKVFEKFSNKAGLAYERSPFKTGNIISTIIDKVKEETGSDEIKKPQSHNQTS